MEQIENSEDVQYQIGKLESKVKTAELKYDERKTALNRLQAQNVRKTTALRRYRQTLEEFGDPKSWASQEDIVKLTELNIAIRQTKNKIVNLEARIADLRQIIDLKRRKMFAETRKAKPDVLLMVDNLKTYRVIDHENSRVLAMNEAEVRHTSELINAIKEEYAEDKVREVARENRILQEQCREFKRKFFSQRQAGGKKMSTLINEENLEQMRRRIMDLGQQMVQDRRSYAPLVVKIDKQTKVLLDWRHSVPPAPAAYERAANVRTTHLAVTFSSISNREF
jgi:hypothetical protein